MQWQMANFNWEKFFDGCVAEDFGTFSNRLVWVYEHQPQNPAVAKHGNVHVTHKAFFADKAANGLPEFSPAVPAPSTHGGIAPYIVDPEGELFMLNIPKHTQDPGREEWVSAKMPSCTYGGGDAGKHTQPPQPIDMPTTASQKKEQRTKRGWGCDKVFGDVLKTATAHQFPASIVNQWKALKQMHTMHATSDVLPQVPFNISPPPCEVEGQILESFRIDGQPVSWSELWRPLAFRFPRSHMINSQEGTHQGHADDDGEGVGVVNVTHNIQHDNAVPSLNACWADARAKRAKCNNVVSAATLAAHNGVTSLNHRPVELARARKAVEREKNLQSLPDTVSKVEKGNLYFVQTSAQEGELKVGLAQALEDGSDSTSKARFKWYTRVEWIRERRHEWGDNTMFIVAGMHVLGKSICAHQTVHLVSKPTSNDVPNSIPPLTFVRPEQPLSLWLSSIKCASLIWCA